ALGRYRTTQRAPDLVAADHGRRQRAQSPIRLEVVLLSLRAIVEVKQRREPVPALHADDGIGVVAEVEDVPGHVQLREQARGLLGEVATQAGIVLAEQNGPRSCRNLTPQSALGHEIAERTGAEGT